MTQSHETQSCEMNLDAAVKEGFADAFNWMLDWQPVKRYDDAHPELAETNESLVAKVSRSAGGMALSV